MKHPQNRTQRLIALGEGWFADRGWKPFKFQREAWEAYLNGYHGLLNAPTGSGKTYAIWTPIILELLEEAQGETLKPVKGLRALWITPLRALSSEILLSAEALIQDLYPGLTAGIRTGDTSQKDRAAQRKRMPNLLVTTPESLHLLLATKGYAQIFKDCRAVVVDEWHELLGSKRGVQMELALSRLRTLCPGFRSWGISATIANLDQAREVLLGPETEAMRQSALVRAKINKQIEVRSLLPAKMDNFPWRGHLGLQLLEQVKPILERSKTTLLFTNTRAQCEIWYQQLLEAYPDLAGELAMHHGSIAKKTRLWVEQSIREERLRAVVCTSSLDLGVDFAPVETVIQIGGPKGVARFLQRAGRSGHRPGQVSVIYFLPTHAMELIEASALKIAVHEQAVEERIPYLNSFDVLLQYLTTLAVSDGFRPQEIYREILTTHCFRFLESEQWTWLLNFLVMGSQSLQAYDEFQKVVIGQDGVYRVESRGVAMRHRMQIGTIVSDASINIHYATGGYVGSIEEWFISQLNPGDVFTFSGKNLEFIRLRQMKAYVRRSNKPTKRVPSWMGGRLSFSAEMSRLLREQLYTANHEESLQSEEIRALKGVLDRQRKESIVPEPGQFLIEQFETREGIHHLFYPFEGRHVHEALSSLLAYRISLLEPVSFTLAFNDYGFELLGSKPIDLQAVVDNNLFSDQDLLGDLQRSLNSSEMAGRKFRDIAVIGGLVFNGFPGEGIKMKHLQSSSRLLFDVFREHEPDNLLFRQAYTETFEHQLEEARLRDSLRRIQRQNIVIRHCETPTPFSFPIITDRLREKMSTEKLSDRIRKLLRKWD